MEREEVMELIRNGLTLTVDVVTTSEYTGGLDGGDSLYKDSHKLVIQLELEGEVFSSQEVYL